MVETPLAQSKPPVASYHQATLAAGAECLAAALNYLRGGWSALCICPPDHMGVGKTHGKSCQSPGKAPWGPWREYQERLPTEEELRAKWRDLPIANVGVALGPVSGLVRIDIDGAGGEDRLAELSRGDLPRTLEFMSGRTSGGRGLLYKIPEGTVLRTTTEKGGVKEELRFQAKGAQTVLPPSRHPSGSRYRWVDGHGPSELELAMAPPWLLAALRPEGHQGNGRPSTADGERIPDGARNTTLTSLAGSMRRRGMTEESIAAALRAENLSRCDPPLGDDEVESIAASVSRYTPHTDSRQSPSPRGDGNDHSVLLGSLALQPGAARQFAPTDLGNAERLAAQHGADLRYCFPWAKWLVWDGTRWRLDDTGAMIRLAKKTVRTIYSEASAAKTEAGRTAIAKWAIASEKADRLAAMITLARSEPGIPVLPEALDNDIWLLNCRNGTINLKTGQLRSHSRDNLITKLCPVVYDSHAEAPLFNDFLKTIFDDNPELLVYIQRLTGYCLTGDVSEQVLPIMWGTGANGKSTLLNVLLDLLGYDYSVKCASDLLLTKSMETHPTEKADLFGKRLAVCLETDQGRRLAESLAKDLTGGDRIRARRMREDFWEFSPTFKLILCTNSKPVIRGTDHAIWRRIRLVPFTITISEERRDSRLLDKLRAELPGILRWAVEGCMGWQKHGLGVPEEVRAATAEYRNAQDVLATFLAERCQVNPECRVKAGTLYAAFRQWCQHAGEREVSQTRFGEGMTARGFERYPSAGYPWYRGLTVQVEGVDG